MSLGDTFHERVEKASELYASHPLVKIRERASARYVDLKTERLRESLTQSDNPEQAGESMQSETMETTVQAGQFYKSKKTIPEKGYNFLRIDHIDNVDGDSFVGATFLVEHTKNSGYYCDWASITVENYTLIPESDAPAELRTK
ncbi:MAG: hypothetical protein ACRCXN_12975 [Bacteroidales bacterium]